jgi:hypothetical protein
LRILVSLSSTLTMRSNTCGGGPSIESKATVGLSLGLAIANAPLLPPPLLAQPPSALAAIATSPATQARSAIRLSFAKVFDASLITFCDIVKIH